ncbi:MAG: SMC-Scp complex subunit ScpB [Candidatus Bathyarchaeota archaeon]|nr:SMC-Scp complex subunit ScpB [Candidatus Bathyarchaeota archaeon]
MSDPKNPEGGETSGSDKEMLDRSMVEAALYVTGRPLELRTLGSVLGTRSKKRVRSVVEAVKQSYDDRMGPLEIIELADERFVLQLKPKFVEQVRRLATRPLLTSGPLRTLAYIAYRQPVIQSQVISVRGSHAYTHIRILETMGLVENERFGRTKLLRTTRIFSDYFNLSHDVTAMKRQLRSIFDVVGKESETK